MWRKVIAATTLVAFIILVLESTRYYFEDGNKKLINVFNESEFDVISVEANIWGEYNKGYISIEEIKSIVAQMAEEIGLENTQEIIEINEKLEKIYYIEKVGAHSTTKIKFVERIKQLEDNFYEANNYILVNIKLTDKCDSISYYNKLIKKIYAKYGMKPKATLTITSEKEEKYTVAESKELIKKMVSKLQLKTQEEFELDNIFNYYGYSKSIQDYIVSDNKKINVTFALTYDEEKNKTILYGATPVITINY